MMMPTREEEGRRQQWAKRAIDAVTLTHHRYDVMRIMRMQYHLHRHHDCQQKPKPSRMVWRLKPDGTDCVEYGCNNGDHQQPHWPRVEIVEHLLLFEHELIRERAPGHHSLTSLTLTNSLESMGWGQIWMNNEQWRYWWNDGTAVPCYCYYYH